MATSRLGAAGATKGAFEDLMTTADGIAAHASGHAEMGGGLLYSSQSMGSLPTCMGYGNSLCSYNRIDSTTTVANYNAHLWWAMALAGQPFQWVQTGAVQQIGSNANSLLGQGIYGWTGATSTDILPALSEITSRAPNFCFVHLIDNDIAAIVAATMTRAQSKANLLSVIQGMLAVGTIPIVAGPLPSKVYSSAALASEYWAMTEYLESLQSTYSQMIYVPVYDLYMDGGLTTPQPLTAGIYANYVDASVHPLVAAPLIGARIADVLLARGIKPFGLLPGPGDARLIGGNSWTSGTDGTASGAYTGGTVAHGLTVNSSATVIGTASVIDRGNRQVQEISVTSGTSTGLQTTASIAGASIAAGASTFAVGDTVQGFIELEIDAATAVAGLRDIRLQLAQTGGGHDAYFGYKTSGTLFDTITIPTGRKMLIATPKSVVPAGTTALQQTCWIFASNNAAAITGKFWASKFAVVNWSKSN